MVDCLVCGRPEEETAAIFRNEDWCSDLCRKVLIGELPDRDAATFYVTTERGTMSPLNTKQFVRKPFNVEGIQVTLDNMAEVATWCGGTVVTPEAGAAPYIKVNVARPLNERQTKGFAGDWILQAGGGFKVYTSKAFYASFDPADPTITRELPTPTEPETLSA